MNADYVSNEQALRDILTKLGYRVIEGDFTRSDGTRAKVAVLPPKDQAPSLIGIGDDWSG